MFSNYFTIQLIEALQLTSIRDRPWRVQPCSALLNDGIDVSFLFKVYNNYYYGDFCTHLQEGIDWICKNVSSTS